MSDVPAVAVIGMSGRFPGARDLDEYWANLCGGVCSIVDFSEEELLAAGVDPAEFRRAGYVPAKGFLAGADRFEAELFGFNRTEAAALDPQHRLLLETAWSALEDAGYNPRDAPDRTGVYVGGSLTEHMVAAYADPRRAAELGGLQLRILTDREFLAPWLSYRLDLDGPSLTVQTACSTSLAAVHLAVQALLMGECDAALAGGVSVDSVRKRGYQFQEGGIFSPDGRCRPFDVNAAGTVSGSGVGVVVLRRLADALADGDPVRAVIAGSAASNDGSAKVGFTAPSVDRQSRAIVEAWSSAGLDPSCAQYIEMHGTGTDLGDRIEVAAVSAAFGRTPERRCGIGSVKSNIGHLDAAAGVASLIKVVLMLGHRTVVPTANASRPHPGLGLAGSSPFELVTRVAPWEPPDDGPRLAGVTAVGIGGTNVHVVVAEPPAVRSRAPADRVELLPLSARTPEQLGTASRRLAATLRRAGAPALADVAHTLRTGRAPLAARSYLVAGSAAEAADVLDGAGAAREAPADLRALGESWVRGEHVDWPAPAGGARRVHLPTYPFAGEPRGAFTLGPTPDPVSVTASGDRLGRVTEVLSGTLGLSGPDGLDGSFFAAGGDSLTAVHLAGRLRDDLGIDVPIELFLEQVSLHELAARITALGEGTADSMLASLLDETAPG